MNHTQVQPKMCQRQQVLGYTFQNYKDSSQFQWYLRILPGIHKTKDQSKYSRYHNLHNMAYLFFVLPSVNLPCIMISFLSSLTRPNYNSLNCCTVRREIEPWASRQVNHTINCSFCRYTGQISIISDSNIWSQQLNDVIES